jgi:lysophospholipase L1-like esterase
MIDNERRARIVRRVFLVQLVLPAFLVWDAMAGLREGFGGRVALVVATLSSIWIVAGLMALRSHSAAATRAMGTALLLVGSSTVCLAVTETAISLAMPVYRTGPSRIFRAPMLELKIAGNPSPFPGREVDTWFRTNELGLRGPSIASAGNSYRILAVGGSTTECFSLDDAQAWPARLMARMAPREGKHAWVQNAGLSGHGATEHLLMLQHHPLAAESDLILILVGVNDLTAALASDGLPSQPAVEWQAAQEFATYPRHIRLASYKLAKYLVRRPSRRYDETRQFYDRMRAQRRSAPVVALPELATGRTEYRDRIRRLAAECRRRERRCVFMSQPALWRADLASHEEASLWMGWIGSVDHPRGYASPAALARAMAAFNEVLLETARSERVEAFDLAAAIPKTRQVFADDSHYTAHGAELVADAVARYLGGTDHRHPSSPH